jgi:hypothetical protein
MQMSETTEAMVVLPIFFFFLLLGVKFFFDWRKIRLKSEFHHKLVDKFSNVNDLNDFLQSKTGANFLRSLTINGLRPKEKLMSAVSTGVIMGFLGIAVLAFGTLVGGGLQYYFGSGIALFVLGIGFLVSALVSYHLSKKWGIIKEEE